MKPLSQSLADATRIIGALVPPGCDSLTFQDGPGPAEHVERHAPYLAERSRAMAARMADWPGGIGDEPCFGEPT